MISADLAYLLYKDRAASDAIENQLRIVGFEPLKGVWGGRHYPVIWYEERWEGIRSTFLYDEHHHNPIIQRLQNHESDPLALIAKVLDDLDRKESAEELWIYVHTMHPAREEPPPERIRGSAGSLVEVHCVAVCFRDDGRALIARRRADKRRFPNQWEFGCGQLEAFESFEQCLRRAYLDDFGADLVFDGPALPVTTYTIEDPDEGRHIPGIIFAAGVRNPERLAARKHAELDWVVPEAPEFDRAAGCVPNFAETLRAAARAWKAMRGASSVME